MRALSSEFPLDITAMKGYPFTLQRSQARSHISRGEFDYCLPRS